jgi:hypothetical protein
VVGGHDHFFQSWLVGGNNCNNNNNSGFNTFIILLVFNFM